MSSLSSPNADRPDWVGYWRVRRYDGSRPDRPTYYDATLGDWTVLTAQESGLHAAPHPILSVDANILTLKDEGEPDKNAERWRVAVDEERLRVTALTGPHEGATGIARRMDADPRTLHDSS